jgi:hypothetical protein
VCARGDVNRASVILTIVYSSFSADAPQFVRHGRPPDADFFQPTSRCRGVILFFRTHSKTSRFLVYLYGHLSAGIFFSLARLEQSRPCRQPPPSHCQPLVLLGPLPLLRRGVPLVLSFRGSHFGSPHSSRSRSENAIRSRTLLQLRREGRGSEV